MTSFHDIETFSTVPISAGTWRYAEEAEVMLWSWADGDGPVQVWDLTTGEPMPPALAEILEKGETQVWHNGGMFDLAVIEAALGVTIPLEIVHDTLAIALAHSLPGQLAKLCDIFGLSADQAKDGRGKKLINLFCVPRPKKQKLRRATRETHPAEWQEFIAYAKQDIEATRAVYKKLPRWNMTPTERAVWLLDQKINRRGVLTDIELANAAVAAIDIEQASLAEQVQDSTLGQVTSANQRDKMIDHILVAYGVPMDDLRGSTIEQMLNNDNYPPELLELLRIRVQASTTSVSKYKRLLSSVSRDGRLRGTLQFCGALRTGRWAGRLMQLQNLPRPDMPTDVIDAGIAQLKTTGTVEPLAFGSVMSLTSNALRGAIIAPPGKKLVVADLSNIEGRVLAWLAGETWKLDAFAAYDRGEGADLYKVTAGRILGKSADDVTKLERQQVGKVAELALGFGGGVGSFLAFATVYNIDIDALAQTARAALDPAVVDSSAGAWDWSKKTKRNTFGLSRETWVGIDAIKRAWRLAHPAISKLWADLEDEARNAIDQSGILFDCRLEHLRLVRQGAWLRMILPSGRSLSYPSPAVDEKGAISYKGVNQYTRKWERISTYGGKLAENATQAVARDVLAENMLVAESWGYKICLSVHDELITETEDTPFMGHEELASVMAMKPGWATGLPLSAAGFECYRYRKE